MTDDREYVETAKMEAFGYTVPDGSEDYKKGFQDGVDFVLGRFYDLPREDVASVIHAHWEKTGWQKHGVEFEYRCSHCKRCKIWKKKTQKTPYYCEKCGAKMDKKEG